MNLVKSNWFRIPVFLLLLIFFWAFVGPSNNTNNQAQINNVIEPPIPTPLSDKNFENLLESLPKFENYPAKVYPIPPKPKLDHNSHPMGMRYWTFTEEYMANDKEYNMSGHFIMAGYGTGNPMVLILDGLSGQIFHEYGGREYEIKNDSNLVIFDPFIPECFSSSGDYDEECHIGPMPRYTIWTGKNFKNICEPVVKNWKLVSCKSE